MSNHYTDALTALKEMQAAVEELEEQIKTLEAVVSIEVKSALLVDHSHIPEWITAANARLLRDKHSEWGRKLYSIIMGYSREMESARKNLRKKRKIGFGDADVTVGDGEKFAKAIQFKHTLSREASMVDQMIGKAANQLSGDSGEHPLDTQRMIVDVMISDSGNLWPFTPDTLKFLDPEIEWNSGEIPFKEFKKHAIDRISSQLRSYRMGRSGINAEMISNLPRHLKKEGAIVGGGSGPKSSLPHVNSAEKKMLTIKIVFSTPRKYKNGKVEVALNKAVFVAYKDFYSKLKVDFLQHA